MAEVRSAIAKGLPEAKTILCFNGVNRTTFRSTELFTTEIVLLRKAEEVRNENMLPKFSSSVLTGVIGFALTCGFAQAQQASDQTPDQSRKGTAERSATAGKNHSVTGCLQQEASGFRISGDDGKSWNLKSTSVKLADHVNHKVTMTGKVDKEGEATTGLLL